MNTPNEIPLETAPMLSASVLRSNGYLHEVNRLVLHPLGLALGVEPNGSLVVFDCREDPEGIYYADDTLSAEKAENVANEMERRGELRMRALGYVIQPLPPDVKQLHVTVRETVGLPAGDPDGGMDGPDGY